MKKKIAIGIMERNFSGQLRLFVLLCFVATLMWSSFSLLAHATAESKALPKSEDEMARDRKIARMIQSHIIKDTRDKDPAIRCQALIALGQWYYFSGHLIRRPPRQPIIDALLRDKDEQVRWTALLILADLPEKQTRDLSQCYPPRGIVHAFQEIVATDRDRDFRRIAAANLLKWDKLDKHEEQIWQYTLEMLQHPDPNYQDYALKALWYTACYHRERMDLYKLHPSVRAQIEEMARTLNPSHALVKTVSYLWKGHQKGRNIPLLKWLEDDDYKLRRTGVLALEKHSRQDNDVATALLDTLRGDSSVKVRTVAAKAITGPSLHWWDSDHWWRSKHNRKFSPQMQNIVWNALVEAARNDAAPEVRAAALLSLANWEVVDASAWDSFTDAMRGENMLVRKAALRGLGQDGKVAVELMDTLRSDSSVEVRVAAAKALLEFVRPGWTLKGDCDLKRRKFPPQMQKKVWNAFVEATRNDAAPEVRAAALLSLANLKEGDASSWDLFTDAMRDDENMLVRKAAVWGVGQAVYLQFNEVIEAALMHVASSYDDAHLRTSAIESLLLFNYWDENIHNFMMNMLKRHPRLTIGLLYEYSKIEPRVRRKLREEFRATDDERMKFYLALALVESGLSDGGYIEHIVHTGLEDAKFTSYCIQVLGCSGYREPFVIEALLEQLRESLVAVEPYKATGAHLYPVTNKGPSYARLSRKGEEQIRFGMEALIRLDKYNADLIALLPQLVYDSGMSGVAGVSYQYAFPYRRTEMNGKRSIRTKLLRLPQRY